MTTEMETALGQKTRLRSARRERGRAREVRKDWAKTKRIASLAAITGALVFLRSPASEQKEMVEAFSLPTFSEVEPSPRSSLPDPEVVIHSDAASVPDLGFIEKLKDKGIFVHQAWAVGKNLDFETDEVGRTLTEEEAVNFNYQAQLIAEKVLNSGFSNFPEGSLLAYKVGTNSNNIPVLFAEFYNQKRNRIATVIYPHEGDYQFVTPPSDQVEGDWIFYKRGLLYAQPDYERDSVWENGEWKAINHAEEHFFIWKVKPGDTFQETSEMYGISLEPLYDALEGAEGHRDATRLQPGMELRVEAIPSRAPFVAFKIPEVEERAGNSGAGTLPIKPVWATCYSNEPECPWNKPTEHWQAWILAGYPKVIFLHMDLTYLSSQLSRLDEGDKVIGYKNFDPPGTGVGSEDGPFTDRVEFQVEGTEVILEDEQYSKVLLQARGDSYAIVSCHPPDDPSAPERFVVWLRPS